MRKLVLLGALAATLALLVVGGAQAVTTCTFTIVGPTMTLDADCTTDASIVVPDGYTLGGAGYTITAFDPAGGHFTGGVVQNGGATANVTNLGVTTSGLADVCDGGAARLRGILFTAASGTIAGNTVTNINQGPSGCQEGNAIEVRNAPFDGTHPNTQSVVISGNVVTDYQKNGITANGDVFATITDNVVSGAGPVGFIAQNGIQIGFGGSGEVARNVVGANWYANPETVATGILLFEATDVTTRANSLSGDQLGVAIESWCFGAPSASLNRVVRNTIEGAEFGVSIATFTFFSSCDPLADNNKVVNNAIVNTATDPAFDGEVGISVGAFDLDFPASGFDPSTANNKVVANEITGYATAIDDTGTATKIHANAVSP